MRVRALTFVLAAVVSAACGTRPPRPEPPEPPATPQPVCAEGQTTCCWHQPPGNQWLYACPAPNVEGGVLNVAGGPAQCPEKRCGDGTPQPPDPQPPTGDVPAVGTPTNPEALARICPDGTWFCTAEGKKIKPFGVEACCMSWEKCPDESGSPRGTGWPGYSACFIDRTTDYGANILHFRFAPWASRCDNWDDPNCGEPYWFGIGGLYNADGSFNQTYTAKVRELHWRAWKRGAYTEYVIGDDWWFKGACGKDNPTCGKVIPMSQAAVDAWGKTWHPEHDAMFKEAVRQLGCFGGTIWTTGNEEDLVPGTTREHLQARVAAIRKYEQEVGCGFVHLIGTGSFKGGIGADYQITHEVSPVTGPCGPDGLPCANNEHNPKPQFTPEHEASLYQQALDAGQRWDAWRAEANDADWEKRLELFRDAKGGAPPATGCFAPAHDDPLWVEPPTSPSVRPAQMMAAFNEAKARVGDRCGATAPCKPEYEPCAPSPIFLGCIETNDLVAAELRNMGFCAGRSKDSVFLLAPDGFWEEYHTCATENGCYTGNPYKFAWQYRGENPKPPVAECPHDVCTVSEILCKIHQVNQGLWDCTPKCPGGAPILPEGDPNRQACEKKACGGGYPTYALEPGSPLTLVPTDNPFQFKIQGSGSGVVKCTTPSSAGANVCKAGDTTLEQGVPVSR